MLNANASIFVPSSHVVNKMYLLRPTSKGKMYLLRPTSKGIEYCGWDCAHGFVIFAKDEKSARSIAQSNGGNEIELHFLNTEFWNDCDLTTCVLLENWKAEGVVMCDFVHG